MGKMQRAWMTFVGTAGLTAAVAVSTALPAAAYSPGTATPYRPVYRAATGAYDYHCSYARWRSGARVTWHCNLYMRDFETFPNLTLVQQHSGSWTPGSASYTTPTYHKPMVVGNGQLCTAAWALSVDGGTNTTYACN
jgi:hypothetical protein